MFGTRSRIRNVRNDIRFRQQRKSALETLETRTLLTTLSFQQGVDSGFGTYTGTRDTYLHTFQPDTNFGSVSPLRADPGPKRDSLIGFDNIIGSSPGQVPFGSTIVSATFQLTIPDTGGRLDVHRMVTDWDVNMVTLNNFQLNGNTIPGLQTDDLEASSTITASFPSAAPGTPQTGTATVDVTSDVQAWANGTDNFGWGLVVLSGDDREINSSEYFFPPERPKLTVEFMVAPTNQPPTAPIDADSAQNNISEAASTGSLVGITASSSDTDGDSVTYSLTENADGRFSIDSLTGVVRVADASLLDGDALHVISIQASDGTDTSSSEFAISVSNVAPEITGVNSDATFASKSLDGFVTLTGELSDPAAQDAHSVFIDWGDGTQTLLAENNPSIDQENNSFVATHQYSGGGIFDAFVVATDDDGASSSSFSTSAVVVGIGVVDGELQVVGSDASEKITVRHRNSNTLEVKLKQFGSAAKTQHISSNSITSIRVLGCGGRDHIEIGHTINLPTILIGGDGNDLIFGGSGNDLIQGGTGNDKLFGRKGVDSLFGDSGNDWIWGNEGGDRIDGGDDNDFLFGNLGDDEIFGGIGNDRLFGGPGNDQLNGDDGNDFLLGGLGTDILDGGAGNDILIE